ncbi:MAG: ATP-binding cassette domain-containing protein [Syntrophobacterales bacterium]|jgi:phospholipid/cholesterol/gamma-HCH transport system ATP-binding protein|nr:ATP-binding cassette domain-containing protein [Syntrophobacterales bacterium]
MTEQATPVIVVEGLTARYDDRSILENVSFRVFQGERFIILGGSGCGKSTLLKHLIGLYRPYSGHILVNGIDIATHDEENLVKARMNIGVLFQNDALFGSMTLSENVALPLQEYTDLSEGIIEQIVRMKLELVRLGGYENHFPSELSGGMRKRAGIARAMALDPQMLFLDEPWAGLDPITAAELDILVRSINTGIGATMVIVTQELASIFAVGQRVIMLDKEAKGIIAEGDPVVLRKESADPRVVNFFNRRAQ